MVLQGESCRLPSDLIWMNNALPETPQLDSPIRFVACSHDTTIWPGTGSSIVGSHLRSQADASTYTNLGDLFGDGRRGCSGWTAGERGPGVLTVVSEEVVVGALGD